MLHTNILTENLKIDPDKISNLGLYMLYLADGI